MYKVLLVALVLNVTCYGDNLCKVPNGDAGTCINIQRCKPLWDLHNKKHKTRAEDTYIRQSFCGYRYSPTLYVCCPSKFTWHSFEANPVIYHNPLDDLNEDTYYPTTQVNVAKETKVDDTPKTPFTSPTESGASPSPTQTEGDDFPKDPFTGPSEYEASPTLTQENVAKETKVDVSPKTPFTSPTESGAPMPPITTETESIPTNEVIPLSRDSPNITESTSNINENDVWLRLGISNRNNKNTCGEDQSYGGNRITGGLETGIDQYTWLVLLQYSSGALGCGGSLITSRYVLTAAHCANSRMNGIPVFVRLSEYNTTSFPTDRVEADGGGFEEINVTIVAVENVWAHPNYTHISFLTDTSTPNSNDIGLVKLRQDAEFTNFINIICLPPRDLLREFEEGLYLSVAGWGDDRVNPANNDVKKQLEIPYVPLEKCRSIHSRALVDSQICAGGEKDKDSCVGDSGGPLMYQTDRQFYLVGVVSYGSVFCGTKGQPGIYTNVYKYRKWISDIVNGVV